MPYFDSLGHCCPTYKNPSDFFMSLAADEANVAQLAELQLQRWALRQAQGQLPQGGGSDVEAPLPAAAPAQAQQQAPAAQGADATGAPDSPRRAAAAGGGAVTLRMEAPGAQLQVGAPVVCQPLARAPAPAALPPAADPRLRTAAPQAAEVGAGGAQGPAVPAWFQVQVLAQRFLRSWLRHPLLLASELGQFIFMAVFLGGWPSGAWGCGARRWRGLPLPGLRGLPLLGGGGAAHGPSRGSGTLWAPSWRTRHHSYPSATRVPAARPQRTPHHHHPTHHHHPLTPAAGLTYLRITSSLPNGLQDRVSSIFFVLASLVWVPSYTIIVVWDKERLLLRRESANGAYRCAACCRLPAARCPLPAACRPLPAACCWATQWPQPPTLHLHHMPPHPHTTAHPPGPPPSSWPRP